MKATTFTAIFVGFSFSLLFYYFRLSETFSSFVSLPISRSSSNDSNRYSYTFHLNDYSNTTIIQRLTFERGLQCNVNHRDSCYRTNKSLVLSFWSEKSKIRWMPENILTAFPSHAFDHIVFVYDNSSWHSHPGYDQFIFIHVKGQIRFWFVKRFLLPSMIKSYRYIWIVDDDSKLNFQPLQYECVINRLDIPLSSPGRLTGAFSHKITKRNENYVDSIGRWTDFVETGPAFVASSSAWECIYTYLDAFTGSGWGLDLIWCNMLAEVCLPFKDRRRVCAILDAFTIDHQSTGMNSGSYGGPELPIFTDKYRSWMAKLQNYDPLASNQSIIDLCLKF